MMTTPLYDLKNIETYIDHVVVDTTTEYGRGYATALAHLKGYVAVMMEANEDIEKLVRENRTTLETKVK